MTPGQLEIMLEKVSDQIINVVFQGDCEPTLNRLLPELVRVAGCYTGSIAVVTNGTRLGLPLIHELVSAGLNWFAFSIDDHRPEHYNRLRIGGQLDQVVGNLKNVIDIRDAERRDLHVVVHKIVFPEDTLDNLLDFVRYFYLELGVNQITFSPLVEEGDVKVREWLLLRNELENRLLTEGVFINLREFGNYPYKTVHKYCGTNLIFINHQGFLSPCGMHVRHAHNFGNLLEQSVDQIEEHAVFQEFYQFWSKKDYSAPFPVKCEDCFLLKGHYHRYTLNEGHAQGLQFSQRSPVADLPPTGLPVSGVATPATESRAGQDT